MAMKNAASSNLTQTHSSSLSCLSFIRRRSTGYRWLGAPSLHPSPPPPQRLVGGEECPCPPSPPLLLHSHLHSLHFLLLSLSSSLQLLLLHPPLSRSLAPGEELGAAAGPAAAEEAEEGYGVCWSSLHGGETADRKRIRQKNRGRK